MALNLLSLGTLGATENNGVVTFGLWLPWVSAGDGNVVSVKIIHETDQFLQNVAPREFPLTHSVRAPYGDFWSATIAIAGTPPEIAGSAWGTPGRYVYRYRIVNPNVGSLDWIIDPYAREFGVGKLSAFTLGYLPYSWSAAELQWKTPPLADLVLYEIDIAELAGDLDRAHDLMAYLSDLGITGVELMPLSNVGVSVDWGYLPIGYFGVDERFGKRSDFQQIVDIAHQHGLAVIVDVVYGHTGIDFPYYDAYTRLQYRDNPFMGPFAKDYFSNFGKSTDFQRQLTRDYFFTVNHHWMEVYHIDGFRYDCVPNYWDGPLGVGYASLVYETYQLAKAQIAKGQPYWNRFDAGPGAPITLIQCAEQLEDPVGVLRTTYSNSTWQNQTFDAAKAVAHGDRGRLTDLGFAFGLFGYPDEANANQDAIPKAALQYLENHDHERFLCNFGLRNPDEAGNPLFAEGDRNNWYMVQPYLIGLLMGKGVPLLWQGQEFGENSSCQTSARDVSPCSARCAGTSSMMPSGSNWSDWSGRFCEYVVTGRTFVTALFTSSTIGTAINKTECCCSRDFDGPQYSLVALNFGDVERQVPFWFPVGGDYVEELHGGDLDLKSIAPLQEVGLTIPSHYGRVWTAVGR